MSSLVVPRSNNTFRRERFCVDAYVQLVQVTMCDSISPIQDRRGRTWLGAVSDVFRIDFRRGGSSETASTEIDVPLAPFIADDLLELKLDCEACAPARSRVLDAVQSTVSRNDIPPLLTGEESASTSLVTTMCGDKRCDVDALVLERRSSIASCSSSSSI